MKLFSTYKTAFSECNNYNLKIFAFTHSLFWRIDLNFGSREKNEREILQMAVHVDF